MNRYIYWKWSNGSIPHKSYISDKQKYTYRQEEGQVREYVQEEDQNREYRQPEEYQIRELNSREQIANEITSRGLMLNTSNNPFFSEQNYVEDLRVRDLYLKPINTSKQ